MSLLIKVQPNSNGGVPNGQGYDLALGVVYRVYTTIKEAREVGKTDYNGLGNRDVYYFGNDVDNWWVLKEHCTIVGGENKIGGKLL